MEIVKTVMCIKGDEVGVVQDVGRDRRLPGALQEWIPSLSIRPLGRRPPHPSGAAATVRVNLLDRLQAAKVPKHFKSVVLLISISGSNDIVDMSCLIGEVSV